MMKKLLTAAAFGLFLAFILGVWWMLARLMAIAPTLP
jgi:hypothetical protein